MHKQINQMSAIEDLQILDSKSPTEIAAGCDGAPSWETGIAAGCDTAPFGDRELSVRRASDVIAAGCTIDQVQKAGV